MEMRKTLYVTNREERRAVFPLQIIPELPFCLASLLPIHPKLDLDGQSLTVLEFDGTIYDESGGNQ